MNLRDLSDSEDDEVVYPESPLQASVQPIGSTSVDNPSDRKYTPSDISLITNILRENEIGSFVVGSAALRYYGCRLVLSFVAIAVPGILHDRATQLLKDTENLVYLGIKPDWVPAGPSLNYPEFKLKDTTLKIILVPDVAWGLRCEPTNIQTDEITQLPYPNLSHFMQSLLKTKDVNFLELLIDGQDSSLEWGFDNLDFGMHSWKRAVWEKCVAEKQKRIPREKSRDFYATRFRRKSVEE